MIPMLLMTAVLGATTPPPANDSTAAPGAKSFAVQVLAVRSSFQVDEMLTRLKVLGYEARVVRDSSGYFKVRVGRYPTREHCSPRHSPQGASKNTSGAYSCQRSRT